MLCTVTVCVDCYNVQTVTIHVDFCDVCRSCIPNVIVDMLGLVPVILF